MNHLSIAARISSVDTRCQCGRDMVYDDGRDLYFCATCGVGDGRDPSQYQTATRKRKRKRPAKVARPAAPSAPPPDPPDLDILASKTEFSVRAEIALSVDFEGEVAKDHLLKKLRNEIMAAIKQAVTITANELQVSPSVVTVQPISFDVAVNDQADLQDEMDG